MITAPTFCGYPTERHPGKTGRKLRKIIMKQFKEKLIVGIDHGYGNIKDLLTKAKNC